MDDLSPDFIARMASRIYNEPPHTNGDSAHGPVSPAPPVMPASPSTAPQYMGSIPASVTTMPPATPMAGMHSMPHTDAAASALPFSKFASWPGTTPLKGDHPAGPAPHVSEHAEAPGHLANPPVTSHTSSSAGLSAFVQRIRQTHLHGGDSQLYRPEETRPRAPQSDMPVGYGSSRPFDVPAIREDFPSLRQKVHGKPLAWFDNAATTQKPQSVIDALSHFYSNDYSNIHRGAHTLAARATDAYEKAREKIHAFLGASSPREIAYVRGTTEGINLVANTYGRKFLQPGDEVLLSILEHHAQIVPWQMVAKDKGAVLRVIPVNDHGEIMLEEYQKMLGPRTKVVALTQASNSLGTILPVEEMTQMAKRYGARVVIDGAQSVAHMPVNLQQMGADFFVFSGHKIFGPTGIGVVFIKEELHEILPPWQGGGNMIRNVTFEETTYTDAPARFEAGTPSIADAVGLGAALDYVRQLGLENIAMHEHKLLEHATEGLRHIDGLRIIGNAREKVGVLSFVIPNRRTEDIGRLLDQEGIAVRAGHHCAQPSLRRFGVESTVRPSFSLYNTYDEVDRLIDAVRRIRRMP
jgi:cysteine desulfurase / selenocysteine lyase